MNNERQLELLTELRRYCGGKLNVNTRLTLYITPDGDEPSGYEYRISKLYNKTSLYSTKEMCELVAMITVDCNTHWQPIHSAITRVKNFSPIVAQEYRLRISETKLTPLLRQLKIDSLLANE